MIGDVPSAPEDVVRDIVLGPRGTLVPAAVPDPPLMQPEVVALTEPVPMLDCVPKPLQAVPCDRAADWLIAPDRPDVAFGAPGGTAFVAPTGTAVPMPDSGDWGIWLPPPGSVVALGSTVSFGFAAVEGAIVVVERPDLI